MLDEVGLYRYRALQGARKSYGSFSKPQRTDLRRFCKWVARGSNLQAKPFRCIDIRGIVHVLCFHTHRTKSPEVITCSNIFHVFSITSGLRPSIFSIFYFFCSPGSLQDSYASGVEPDCLFVAPQTTLFVFYYIVAEAQVLLEALACSLWGEFPASSRPAKWERSPAGGDPRRNGASSEVMVVSLTHQSPSVSVPPTAGCLLADCLLLAAY